MQPRVQGYSFIDPTMRLGKRGRLNKTANHRLAEEFLKRGITHCEKCGLSNGLTWAHRKKRRYYTLVEELCDFDNVILLCLSCHQKIEYDKQRTEELFNQLRP